MKAGDILIAKKNIEGLCNSEDKLIVLQIRKNNAKVGSPTKVQDRTRWERRFGVFVFDCTDEYSAAYIWKFFYTIKECRKMKLIKLGLL